MAHYIKQTHDFDRKYGNRLGVYYKPTGELQAAYRAGAGDPSEIPPESPELKASKGYQRSKAMMKRIEERA